MTTTKKTTETTVKTVKKDFYNMQLATYTAGKEAMRIKQIIENVNQSQNGYKFATLNKDDLGNDYSAYMTAVDMYHKSLYQSESTVTQDKYLIDILCLLSVKNDDIPVILSKNIHNEVAKFTVRQVQRMTPEGREKRDEIGGRLEAAKEIVEYYNERGKMPLITDEDGNETPLDMTIAQAKQYVESIKLELDELLKSAVYEAAELSAVTLGTFKKNFELFLGGMLSEVNIMGGYVTLEERKMNNKWNKQKKRAADVNIPENIFMEYWKRQDIDGLKKLIKEKREAMEKNDKKAS